MIGEKYWLLTIKNIYQKQCWWRNRQFAFCVCDCGTEVVRRMNSLKNNHNTHCWCLNGIDKAKLLIGQTYWIITVTEVYHNYRWTIECKYKCECWKESSTEISNLKVIKSCWCQRGTHWMRKHKSYRAWIKMKSSCTNPNDPSYYRRWYRGISYPVEREKFETFREDIKDWYEDWFYFIRKDVFADYSKENCERSNKYPTSKLDMFDD